MKDMTRKNLLASVAQRLREGGLLLLQAAELRAQREARVLGDVQCVAVDGHELRQRAAEELQLFAARAQLLQLVHGHGALPVAELEDLHQPRPVLARELVGVRVEEQAGVEQVERQRQIVAQRRGVVVHLPGGGDGGRRHHDVRAPDIARGVQQVRPEAPRGLQPRMSSLDRSLPLHTISAMSPASSPAVRVMRGATANSRSSRTHCRPS